MYNEVSVSTSFLSLESNYNKIRTTVLNCIYSDVYSYFVGRKDDVITVKIYTAVRTEFNTINRNEAEENMISSIIDYIVSLSNHRCITFKQPPLELIIELYQPMFKKMVDTVSIQWKHLDKDELMSIMYYIVSKLYRNGYYLNRKLIWTSFTNEVLMECRRFKGVIPTISFEDMIKSNIKVDDEEVTYGDLIEDESYKIEKEKEDRQQLEKFIFEQVKDVIIEKIGVRRWDRLWRDYGKGHTINTTQQEMKKLKALFKELGLTRQDFINAYRR